MVPLEPDETWLQTEASLLHMCATTANLSTPTGIGRAREHILANGVRPQLPARIQVVRGEIVDSRGQTSGETDCIFLDGNGPRRETGGETVTPVESAIAMAEFKSSLAGDNLRDAMLKVARVKRLVRSPETGMFKTVVGARVPVPPVAPAAYIVAVDAPSWGTITDHLAQHPEWYDGDFLTYGPELIVVLGKGVLFKNDGAPWSKGPGRHEVAGLETRQSGLQVLTMHLVELVDRYGNLSYERY